MTFPAAAALLMAGATFYAGFYQFFIFARRRKMRVDLTFALMCFAMGLYDLFSVGLYNSSLPQDGVRWQRVQMIAFAFTGYFFLWFVVDFLEYRTPRWFYGIVFVLLTLVAVQIIDRTELTWKTDAPRIKIVQVTALPTVTYYEAAPGPWVDVQNVISLLLMGYVVWLLINRYRYEQRSVLPLLLAVFLFFVAGMNDMAIMMGLYSFYYLVEFSFLAIVVVMTYSLSEQVAQAENIRRALHVSETRFRSIVDALPMGMLIYRLEDNNRLVIVGANLAAGKLLHRNSQELIGKNIEDAFPTFVLTEILEKYRMICRTGEIWHTEIIDHDGEEFQNAFDLHAFRIAPNEVVALFLEITERLQAVKDLRANQQQAQWFSERLKELIQVTNQLSTVPSFDQLCQDAIRLGQKLLHYDRMGLWYVSPDRQHMLGTFGINENGKIRDEREQKHLLHDHRLNMQVMESKSLVAISRADELKNDRGEIVGHGDHAIAGLWNGKETIGFVSVDNLVSQRPIVAQDIDLLTLFAAVLGHLSSLKLAEEAVHKLTDDLELRVQQRTAELKAKNRELETFSYSVSHDLKAPLRAIHGYAHILKEDYSASLPPEAGHLLQLVADNVLRMHQLIEDLLSYSHLEMRKISSSRVYLPKLVTNILAEREGELEAFGIDVVNNPPQVDVEVEIDGLTQALKNLIDNALKFSSHVDNPRIEVGGTVQENSCLLWVKDNGIGFEMQYHDQIFEVFQRLNSHDEYPGTGIGLALVRKVMQRIGGRAWAESVPGEGAIFYLEIPRIGEGA